MVGRSGRWPRVLVPAVCGVACLGASLGTVRLQAQTSPIPVRSVTTVVVDFKPQLLKPVAFADWSDTQAAESE